MPPPEPAARFRCQGRELSSGIINKLLSARAEIFIFCTPLTILLEYLQEVEDTLNTTQT
jgi:hypothetical protein